MFRSSCQQTYWEEPLIVYKSIDSCWSLWLNSLFWGFASSLKASLKSIVFTLSEFVASISILYSIWSRLLSLLRCALIETTCGNTPLDVSKWVFLSLVRTKQCPPADLIETEPLCKSSYGELWPIFSSRYLLTFSIFFKLLSSKRNARFDLVCNLFWLFGANFSNEFLLEMSTDFLDCCLNDD